MEEHEPRSVLPQVLDGVEAVASTIYIGAATTFKVDAAQLDATRSARAEGRSWEEIAKRVNPDYGLLSGFEQSLYQRALQLAVDATPDTSH